MYTPSGSRRDGQNSIHLRFSKNPEFPVTAQYRILGAIYTTSASWLSMSENCKVQNAVLQSAGKPSVGMTPHECAEAQSRCLPVGNFVCSPCFATVRAIVYDNGLA